MRLSCFRHNHEWRGAAREELEPLERGNHPDHGWEYLPRRRLRTDNRSHQVGRVAYCERRHAMIPAGHTDRDEPELYPEQYELHSSPAKKQEAGNPENSFSPNSTSGARAWARRTF